MLAVAVYATLGALVPYRNCILHGRQVAYGKAKLSTQLLLLLWVFCHEFTALEHGMIASMAWVSSRPPRAVSPGHRAPMPSTPLDKMQTRVISLVAREAPLNLCHCFLAALR